MNTYVPDKNTVIAKESASNSLENFFAPIDKLAKKSANLARGCLGTFQHRNTRYEIPRYLFSGPRSGDESFRIGIFGGIHGDEVSPSMALRRFIYLLEEYPEVAKGYCLAFYPIVNPSGFENNSRHSHTGRDLNREFWRKSSEPEIVLLEEEILKQQFHGIISLHSDDTSSGIYGFAHGTIATQNLLTPALKQAETVLPKNIHPRIDGFRAKDGIIRGKYDGMLSAPQSQRPKPFEIVLEVPQKTPMFLQEQALLIAVSTILVEFRGLKAFAANL